MVAGLCIIAQGCGETKAPVVEGTGDLTGYELTAISGSDLSRAVKNENGAKAESGFVSNGLKQGTWLTYYQDGRVKTIDSYVDNKLEGVRIQLDQRSQVTTQEFYSNGNYHGEKTTYKFGRPQEIIPYSNGIIDGKVRRYYVNGKMMEEIEYKNGKQDGIYHHYNEQEQLDLKYEYKNGEKVSGGMVEVGGNK